MYGHAHHLLACCTNCGATASFRDDDTLQPLCRGCLELADAQAAAKAALRATDTHTLLTKAYALTHRLHAMHGDRQPEADLRVMRDAITAEVIRRASLYDMPLPDPLLPGLTHARREYIVDGLQS